MITTKEIKSKNCANCGNEFKPFKSTDRVCSYGCSIRYQEKKDAEKKEKQKDRDKKTQQLHQEFTEVFNRYIRLRDRGKECITCSKSLGWNITKYDAGHRFSVGAYPELRYNVLNVNGQCKECNQDKGGNYYTYSLTLPYRIGQDEYNGLILLKNIPRKYSEYELKALILKYKKLCKTLASDI